LSAAALSAAALSVANVAASDAEDVATVAVGSELVPQPATLEITPSNKTAPIAVMTLRGRTEFMRATAGGVTGATPGEGCAVHCVPSQYLCWPSS